MNEKWLLITAFVLLPLTIWLVSVYLEESGVRIGRKEYGFWVLGILVLFKAPEIISEMGIPDIDEKGLVAAYCGLINAFTYLFARRTAQRSRTIGWGKDAAYLMILPVVNLYMLFMLLRKNPPEPKPR